MDEYASRMAERYATLHRIAQPEVPIVEGYMPLAARGGPVYGIRELDKLRESLQSERRRARQARIDELLAVRPQLDWLCSVPVGEPTPVDEVVRHDTRVVLLSEAGAGKTTALHYLAAHPPVEGMMAILVDLPDLAAAQGSLPERLSADAQRRFSLERPPAFFADALKDGQVLLCLDGLDEIAEQEERARMVCQIASWAEQFPRSRFVVAARANAYEPTLDRGVFAHYTLAPWNEAIAADLERAWNEALDAWAVDGRAARRAFYAARHRLWSHLALAMHEQGRLSASQEEARAWLAGAAEHDPSLRLNRRGAGREAASLLDESLPHLDGMVREQEGRVRFAWRLLQDLLAARTLEARFVERGVESTWARIQLHLWDATWAETLALTFRFLSQDHPALWGELLAHALDAGQGDPLEATLHRHLLLAARALAASDGSDQLDRALRTRIVDALVSWAGDVDAVGRWDAAHALLQLPGDAYAVEKALQLAQDGALDEWACQAAALLLSRLGHSRPAEAISALQALIENAEKSERVRMAAITALGELALGAALDETSRPVVARMAAWVRDPEMPHDLRAEVAGLLGRAVAAERDEAALEALIALARAENEDEKVPYAVQIAAARAVLSVAQATDDAQLGGRLWEWAADQGMDASVRVELAGALGRGERTEEAARLLLSLAQDRKAAYVVQRDALDTLARLGYADESIVDEVVAIAQTADRRVRDMVRLAAARALDMLASRALAVEHILRLVADKSVSITTRQDAFAVIGELGLSGQDVDLDEATVAILRVWANEENTTEEVREQAVQTLTLLGVEEEAFVRDLAAMVQNKRLYGRVRRAAARALGALSTAWAEPACEALRAMFYDLERPNDPLRVVVARSLLRFVREEGALDYLKAAAEQSYLAPVRYQAALVLGENGVVEEAIPPLLALVQDAKIADDVRQGALRALGLWGTGREQVMEGLLNVLTNPELEPTVREEAYAGLKAVTTT